MSILTTYEFNTHRIRTIQDINGRTWWGMKDLIAALLLEEMATQWWLWLECNEKDNKSFLGPQGRQYMRMVNRDGLNKMLDDSPIAEDFISWAQDVFSKQKHASMTGNKHAERLYTPTRIGAAIGGISAQRVNQLLCRLGMQTPVMDFNRKRYLLTDVGRALGVLQTFRKKNNEETTGIMWKKPIISLLAARLRAEERESQHA